MKLSMYTYIGIVFACSTLHPFPYLVPADAQGIVQHVILRLVPVDVLPKLWSWFSQVKQLECHDIHPPQEVQRMHMRDDCEESPEEMLALTMPFIYYHLEVMHVLFAVHWVHINCPFCPLLLLPIERVLLGRWW